MEQETKKCPYCGEEIMVTAKKCRHCGEWLNGTLTVQPEKLIQPNQVLQPIMAQQATPMPNYAVNVNNNIQAPVHRTNSLATAGLTFAVLGMIITVIPVLGLISIFFALAAVLLSVIGLSKEPRGRAIVGLIMGIVGIIIYFILLAAGAAVFDSI